MSQNRSITVLAMDDDEKRALVDWSRGLDWVAWLLGGIRARLGPERSQGLVDEVAVFAAWEGFARGLFLPVLGPALREAWQAAQEGRTRGVLEVAHRLERELPGPVGAQSQEAARILLRDTRRASFQEVLGKHRAAIEQGRCAPHLVCVWAATGVLFQLGLANVCAEYLRLEWALRSGQVPALTPPEGDLSILALTGALLRQSDSVIGDGSMRQVALLDKKEG